MTEFLPIYWYWLSMDAMIVNVLIYILIKIVLKFSLIEAYGILTKTRMICRGLRKFMPLKIEVRGEAIGAPRASSSSRGSWRPPRPTLSRQASPPMALPLMMTREGSSLSGPSALSGSRRCHNGLTAAAAVVKLKNRKNQVKK